MIHVVNREELLAELEKQLKKATQEFEEAVAMDDATSSYGKTIALHRVIQWVEEKTKE